jgi:hypothetical protein
MIDLASLLRFPCTRDKHPLVTAWQKNAGRRDHSRWPLVGVPTGEVNGFDVLDIDLVALNWRDQNRDRFPFTQVHTTRSGGWHFLFRHAPGLRNSASRIAPGVDVRADGGFVIWWPAAGLPSTPAELAEWPDWLLAEALRDRRSVRYSEAPCGGALHHGEGMVGRTLNPGRRIDGLMLKVEAAQRGERNRLLNWVSYVFGAMIAEGVLKRSVAEELLRSAAWINGLWREDGAEQCRATIRSGLDAGMTAQPYHDAPAYMGPMSTDLHPRPAIKGKST